ncbi:Bestrophin, RFP-TM, chloride channel [Pseudomonas prosekii]|uniref:Bestrophin, RFP-TM, chloride channel n=1 Tax=Pseudomonas prosekii TaxID=1148509 RepID=A0A1H2BSE6_9PSED|nr:Bestrophin, RFP-TM, chloride channel [Pseudomonas prosekii]
MIVRPKPNLIGILFSLKGSIAKRIALRSLLVTLLASVIVLVETWHPAYFSKVNATPFTLLGLSLSIFMSFRTIDAQHPNIPDALLQRIGARCSELAELCRISDWRYTQLESRLVSLSQVQFVLN